MVKKNKRVKKQTAKNPDVQRTNSLTIVLAGEAGQGIQSIETVLVGILKKDGFNVFATKEYMSRVRGGVNSTEIRISEKSVRSHTGNIDVLIPFNDESVEHLRSRITSGTVVLGDNTQVHFKKLVNIPFQRIASEFGNPIYANTVAVGTICGILGVNDDLMLKDIIAKFLSKGGDVSSKNGEAAMSGYTIGKELKVHGIIKTSIKKDPKAAGHIMVNGAEAIALGAIAGGCNACFAYPMTPSTGVFTSLAGYSHKAGIVVEQVEDEIGVMNMSLGAWYAGARAIISTAGGGFALMTEAVSLAGMIESPAVIHLAGRPGPATGLPTRTEQGDLNLALYAGHGYFPRIILAPGDTKQGFYLAQQSFNLADKYQVPVFILTDQYYVDSYYNTPAFDTKGLKVEKYITQTSDGYKRYALTKEGISPRGIPGFGSGSVCADSDEHDEEGRITEDLDGVRTKMVEKRMKKAAAVRKAAIAPELIGPKNYKKLIVSWGSNYNTILEAMCEVNDGGLAFLHFPQVYPLPPETADYLKKAKKLMLIENNETGQFGDLIKLETGIDIRNRVLKYNGMPFSVEEIKKAISDIRYQR
jgi:2-oxoglutarate ferredoxin oxidoreductase subunit alpha